jgi:hypothetical protein
MTQILFLFILPSHSTPPISAGNFPALAGDIPPKKKKELIEIPVRVPKQDNDDILLWKLRLMH